jgi:hypothetical protein|tara:strand:- start:25 stop:1479 length:1455 start_codon:yes stop_codon:yes gene_type:complete
MAKQGLLAQSRPAADTDTILYRAPIDKSASTVLTIANDGSASTFDVAVKDYDQKLTLDASTYKLHEGDVISAYRVALNTAMLTTTDITPGQSITTTDAEKSFKFESFYVPPFTEIFVKSFAIRAITVESITGKFSAGETFTKGSAPNATTAVVYGQNGSVVYIGASTLNGTGTEFAAGDSVSSASGDATISTGGVGTAANDFVFSTTTSGGTYAIKIGTDAENLLTFFDDRTYRFNVSDSTMASKEFILSKTVNGEWGPDGTAGNSDDGVEYTTNKTTSGTPGQSGAYVQYAFNGSGVTSNLYFYEGTTGTAANASYGGADRLLTRSTTYEYNEIFIFDKVGTLGNNVDTFTLDGVTYTITGQTAGAYGYVKDYTGTSLKFIKGLNSADWSQSDTFRDVPKLNSASRTTATISSIAVASGAVETSNYIATNHANANNNDEKITSLVVGPGEVVVVNSTTQNNVFSLIGFEDTSDSITTRVHGQS